MTAEAREVTTKKTKEKRQNKINRRIHSARTKFLERIKKSEHLSHREIRINPQGQAKMSEILLDFAGPLLENLDPKIPEEKIIGIATLAWNLSLFGEKERKENLDQLVRELSRDNPGAEEIKDIIEWLVARKSQLFAEHKRFIVDFELPKTGNRRRLFVVSTKGGE